MNAIVENASGPADLALVAEWLAAQILTPPDTAMVEAARARSAQDVLDGFGALLARQEEIDRLRHLMTDGAATEVAAALQRRHTTLFEGIFHQRCLPPYASVWDGTGRLCGPAVGRMQAILRRLDVHLVDDCSEMPDHLGIQLAALAEAMRQERADVVEDVLAELHWVGRFADALIKADGDGFYGTLAALLLALLVVEFPGVGRQQDIRLHGQEWAGIAVGT
ncbi:MULTISPECIES: molecular chaperone TorD family protein [Rhodopseudomonas]|uniref:TorD/DmsD family molecular chaperone n=1 Tax=Rhodopseudomonas TaxID=1073 RepID=UPI000695DB37|nr:MULTISPECIES: molecular chaperone TorD family protein [Rhodopseudomonas]MDF3810139.1 molecular chaperone TorD family protein [Rhodopseudomonas sp. BAL398]WOK18238.1 molecular chaperone TorD family protein [Rhodopseudomonas sp. BAL398]